MKKQNTTTGKDVSYKNSLVALGVLTVIGSFALGIQTSGDVQTVAPTEASDEIMTGDMNNDQTITIQDALLMLEIAQGYTRATPDQLRADPNQDGSITVDDAVRILHDIASRS